MAVQVGKKSGNLEGTTFADRYEIVRRIGEGGMGMVYEARDTRADDGRIVAIKVLHRDVCNDDKAVRRFFSEARVLSSLSHPHIIELFDFGRSDDKRLYIAMELLEGRPADVLIKHKQLTPLDALQILDQTAAGLGEAHLQGVIHRDLKPANIFACKQPDGSLFVTVLDFGIAKITGGQNLTVTGKVMGTPSYMAPEQIMGNQPDPRTDIYALGAMGYELICGRPPFVADTPLTLLYSHLNDTPPSLLDLAPRGSIGKPFADVLFTFLAKDPEHRPRNTVEVRKLLAPFLEDPSRITSNDVDLSGVSDVELLDSDKGSARGAQVMEQMPSGPTKMLDQIQPNGPGPQVAAKPAEHAAPTAMFDIQKPTSAPGGHATTSMTTSGGSSNTALLWGAILVVAILLAAALAVVAFLALSHFNSGSGALPSLEQGDALAQVIHTWRC